MPGARRKAGFTARCWRRPASPASSTSSKSPYGGFCTTFSRSTDRFSIDELSSELGRQWETMGIALKFYSCVGSNHTTLDAIRMMQAMTPFGPEDIASIVVHGSHVTVEHVGWPYTPQGLTSAQLNLPFCVATLLIESDVFVDQFTDDIVDDQRRIDLSKKSACWKTRRSPRAARATATWCASRCSQKRRQAGPDCRGAARQRKELRVRSRHRAEVQQTRDPRGQRR